MRKVYDKIPRINNSDMSDDVTRMRNQIASLERDVRQLSKMIPSRDPDSIDPHTAKDAMWKCSNCNSLLAWYSVEDDLLRIRYKDHIVLSRIGVGGHITVMCRGCAQPCTQHYVEKRDDSAEPG